MKAAPAVLCSRRRVLILQHASWEGPGLIAEALSRRRMLWERRFVLNDSGPRDLPDIDHLAGLVIMGGPMGALDLDRHPGLEHERVLARRCVEADVPVLGICLGHQILALALGAELRSGGYREIGVGRVEVHDPQLGARGNASVLHWHEDAVTLPPGAELLASSRVTANQGFRLGSATGLQFHLEVGRRRLAQWLEIPAMVTGLDQADRDRIRDEFAAAQADMRDRARAAFDRFAGQAQHQRQPLAGSPRS